MNYDDGELEEKGFKTEDEDEFMGEPMEDFGLDEEDPDQDS